MWHHIARRCDQRDTANKKSPYAAPNSIISDRDCAKEVEHFEDILRRFTNKANNYEGPVRPYQR